MESGAAGADGMFKRALGAYWPGAGKTAGAREYSSWSHLFPNCQHSPLEFYAALEAELAMKSVPEMCTGRVTWKERGIFSARREYLRVERMRYIYDICAAPFGEDFFFSAWLVILPPALNRFHFLGMATTFVSFAGFLKYGGFWGLLMATGLFVALFWAVRTNKLEELVAERIPVEDYLLGLTIFMAIYDRFFRPLTYFEQDTAAMFQKSVLGTMQEVIDGLSQAKGLRIMTEQERTPLITGFHKR